MFKKFERNIQEILTKFRRKFAETFKNVKSSLGKIFENF